MVSFERCVCPCLRERSVLWSLAQASSKRGEITLCAGRRVRGKRTGRKSRPASLGMTVWVVCGMRRGMGNGDRACARRLPGQWLGIIGEVVPCGIERVNQECGDWSVFTRAFGAVLRQAASRARCSVAMLTDFRRTVVLPFRPQAPEAGTKAFGSSFISSACCSGVSLTMPQDLSG